MLNIRFSAGRIRGITLVSRPVANVHNLLVVCRLVVGGLFPSYQNQVVSLPAGRRVIAVLASGSCHERVSENVGWLLVVLPRFNEQAADRFPSFAPGRTCCGGIVLARACGVFGVWSRHFTQRRFWCALFG